MCFSLFQNEAALWEISGQPAAEEAPQQDGPEPCPTPQGSFEQWLEQGCPEVESPAPEDAGEDDWYDEMDHYSQYYQTHYWSAADGSSYQHSQDKGSVFFVGQLAHLCPCRTGQRLRSMMATVGLTTRRTMAIGPVTRHMKAMTGSHRTMAIGLQTMELGPRTPRRICKVGPLQSWSTDHDSMAAGSHHDDGTWNQGVKNDHADGHCADQQDRCCFFSI